MIPVVLRITLSIAVICYFILVLYYLKKRMLELKYTLLWLLAGVVMGIMIFFPQLLVKFVRILGIESNMNGLYVLCLGFILAILMSLTSIVSRQSAKIRLLVQQIAIMEKRIRELENKLTEDESYKDDRESKGSSE